MSDFLFSEFDAPAPQAWRDKLARDLKGKTFDELFHRSPEGLDLPPFVTRRDLPDFADAELGQYPYRRGNYFNKLDGGSWQIVQEISVDDTSTGRQRLEEALAAEVSAVKLYSWQGGAEAKNFAGVIEAVDTRYTALHIYASYQPQQILEHLLEQVKTSKQELTQLTGTLTSLDQDASPDRAAAAFRTMRGAPFFRPLGVDLTFVDENGGHNVHQLAFALSRAVDWLSGLDAPADEVAQSLAFTFPVGSDFWTEVAKFRAFRTLIARVLEVMNVDGAEAQSPFVLAQTGRYNKTRYDIHTNLLRLTTEAMSAVVGGAQAVTIAAFDKIERPETAFSARLARNIQHLLRHESYFDRTPDPAGGAYYAELLTEKMADAAWALFQRLEKAGGYASALRGGMIDELLHEAAKHQHEAVDHRKRIFVGATHYPNPDEKKPWETAERLLESVEAEGPGRIEALRLQMDRYIGETEKNIEAFYLSFGDLKMRNARAQFARNLLGCIGLTPVENRDATDWKGSLEELAQTNPALVVLCAADEDYTAARIQEVRKTVSEAMLLVAGKTEVNVDGRIYLGVDARKLLENIVARFT